jgi:hypothetical protein
LGAVVTVVMHMLLISPLLFGGGRQMRTLLQQEGGATMSGVTGMTLVELEDSVEDPPESERQAFEKLSKLLSPEHLLLPLGSFHLATSAVLPPIGDVEAAHFSDSGPPSDDGEHALMFGRYLGQVTARIERAWVRPRTAIGSASFVCLVQVEQDRERNVKEVTLKQCNGTTAWQLSLVRAIESASPFPAPPEPAVFSHTLTFEMTADAFTEGGSAEGYEPLAPDAGKVASAIKSSQALEEVIAKLRGGGRTSPGIIELRIQGTSRMDVVPLTPAAEQGRTPSEGGVASP